MKTKDELNKELELLKSKHKSVFTIEIPTNDEETEFATIFLKKADRMTHDFIWKLYATSPSKALEATLKTNYIGGDALEVVLADDDMLFACESSLAEYLARRQATLKKN